MASGAPSGLIGGIGGALGSLPIVSAARGLALRVASPPRLPGAELSAGDVKLATYAEAAAFLVAVPLAALVFGALLPRWLESRSARRGPSFEWAAAGFAAAFPLWRSGASARWALAAGLVAAAGAAALLFLARRRAVPICIPEGDRSAFASIAAAAAAWEIGRRASGCGLDSVLVPLGAAALAAALPWLFLPLLPGLRSRA
ncbi:MAG TPA: hypothetical protein VLG15_12930 [Thermoanaerobaculia bacterium]|nr:hypothetical protein [Thermoanaerobaculia bacterium]